MSVEALFWLPRPKGHYRVKGGVRPSAPPWPTTKPDGDKLLRALMDGLTTAGIWWDDSQAVHISARKLFVNDGPPSTSCTITHLDEKDT